LVAHDQPYHRALRAAVFYYPTFTELPGQRGKVPKVLDEELPTNIPIQLVRVGKERPLFQESAERFLAKLRKEQVPTESIQHRQAMHGFDYTSEDQETTTIIKRTIAFLKGRILPDGSQQ
jgi:acetyl esterase/lipase